MTPGVRSIVRRMAATVSVSAARSTRRSMLSRKMPKATLKMNRQMTIDAMGSRIGRPSRAPSTPAKLPMDDSASER